MRNLKSFNLCLILGLVLLLSACSKSDSGDGKKGGGTKFAPVPLGLQPFMVVSQQSAEVFAAFEDVALYTDDSFAVNNTINKLSTAEKSKLIKARKSGQLAKRRIAAPPPPAGSSSSEALTLVSYYDYARSIFENCTIEVTSANGNLYSTIIPPCAITGQLVVTDIFVYSQEYSLQNVAVENDSFELYEVSGTHTLSSSLLDIFGYQSTTLQEWISYGDYVESGSGYSSPVSFELTQTFVGVAGGNIQASLIGTGYVTYFDDDGTSAVEAEGPLVVNGTTYNYRGEVTIDDMGEIIEESTYIDGQLIVAENGIPLPI